MIFSSYVDFVVVDFFNLFTGMFPVYVLQILQDDRLQVI